MKTYSFNREELLTWIPLYILDKDFNSISIKKCENIINILCDTLELDIDKCSDIEIINSKYMSPKLKFNYDK